MILSPQVTGSQMQPSVVQQQGVVPTGPQQVESSQETKPFQFTAQGAIDESKQLVARAEELLNISETVEPVSSDPSKPYYIMMANPFRQNNNVSYDLDIHEVLDIYQYISCYKLGNINQIIQASDALLHEAQGAAATPGPKLRLEI